MTLNTQGVPPSYGPWLRQVDQRLTALDNKAAVTDTKLTQVQRQILPAVANDIGTLSYTLPSTNAWTIVNDPTVQTKVKCTSGLLRITLTATFTGALTNQFGDAYMVSLMTFHFGEGIQAPALSTDDNAILDKSAAFNPYLPGYNYGYPFPVQQTLTLSKVIPTAVGSYSVYAAYLARSSGNTSRLTINNRTLIAESI